jgi:hypothetical protein
MLEIRFLKILLLIVTALPFFILLISVKGVIIFSYLHSILKFCGKKYCLSTFHMPGIDTDPDRHALDTDPGPDADPDPSK